MSSPDEVGDHDGEKELPSFVRGRTPEPSQFIINTFLPPRRVDEKTILSPSGDHFGFSLDPSPMVSMTISDPVGEDDAMSKALPFSKTKRILSPLGDQFGESS